MNIIVLCSYWNEIDWVGPSLEQLDELNPTEAIICEGCFDPRYPVHSTDGTREIIRRYVAEREFARLIAPVRLNAWSAVYRTWLGHAHLPQSHRLFPARLRSAIGMVRYVAYRRNQALTFNSMIDQSVQWEPGKWFMTYDADQYYSDALLERFSGLSVPEGIGLLTGRELTFMDGFGSYTTDYEKRTFNNMPHRIYPSTLIVPTRRVVLEGPWARSLYIDRVKADYVGEYHHYRFRNRARERLTYAVGDRNPPPRGEMRFRKFEEEHPMLIRRHFGL